MADDMYSNEFGAQQADIARRQLIAKMLMQQGAAPVESAPAGRFVAPISPWQGAAKMFAAYQGAKQDREATQASGELDKKVNQDLFKGFDAMAQGNTDEAMKIWSANPKGQDLARALMASAAKQTGVNEKDLAGKYTPESIGQFLSTGRKDWSLLKPYVKPQKQEWWQSPEGVAARKDVAAAGRPSVSVDVNTGPKSFWNDFGKKQATAFQVQQDQAKSAADQITQLNEARKLLDSGVFTGTGADLKLKAGKALKAIGFNVSENEIANTEAFVASMGRQTLELVKGLGAGTSISNADRDFAAEIAGGRKDLDEQSIRRLFEINERAARATIKKYNTAAEKIKTDPNYQDMPLDIMVNEPPAYQPQPTINDTQSDPITTEMKRRGLL